MHDIRVLEAALSTPAVQDVFGRLADTGGSSLAFVAWIAGILIFVGAVIVAIAIFTRRKKANAASVELYASENPVVSGDTD